MLRYNSLVSDGNSFRLLMDGKTAVGICLIVAQKEIFRKPQMNSFGSTRPLSQATLSTSRIIGKL